MSYQLYVSIKYICLSILCVYLSVNTYIYHHIYLLPVSITCIYRLHSSTNYMCYLSHVFIDYMCLSITCAYRLHSSINYMSLSITCVINYMYLSSRRYICLLHVLSTTCSINYMFYQLHISI